MGAAYAAGRNHDPGPDPAQAQGHAVSGLSPWVRHRLILESEAVAAAIAGHGAAGAARFIEEVFWRSYWKGWLELRPAVWAEYRHGVARAHAAAAPGGLGAALAGATGIDCFDSWVAELIATGRLHNHARMWFASIWIFTLRLPWVLGADFFLRHLLDGDAASNTLSWRWVAGIQTRGKPYVATADNIARYTGGRFNPRGRLNEAPDPVIWPDPPAPAPLPRAAARWSGRAGLLLHEDDLCAESLALAEAGIVSVAGLGVARSRSPLGCAPMVAACCDAALADGLARAGRHFGAPTVRIAPEDVVAWATQAGCTDIVTAWAPAGWVADALAGIEVALAARGMRLHPVRRDWDEACWPGATKGFFPFRAQIPALLRQTLGQ